MTVKDKHPVCLLDLNANRSVVTPSLQHFPNAKSGIGETAGVSSSAFEYTLLRVLAGNVPNRIYAKDTMGRFIFANGAVARGMGVSDPVELLGKTDFDFYPLELATEYHRQEQATLTYGRSILNQEEHAKYLLLKDEAWMITTKVAVRDETGQIIGLVGINYEVTTQKAAELALQAAHAQAAEVTVRLKATVARLDLEVKERMPRLIGPDFIGIQVADLNAARTFYTKVVGLTVVSNGPPGAVVFDTKPIPFAVRTPVVDLHAVETLGHGIALWFGCDDAEALHDHLASRDVLIAFPPKHGPFGRYFAFQDPFGYTITAHTVQEAA